MILIWLKNFFDFKTFKPYFFIIFFILYFIPTEGYKIYDITNNSIASDFFIQTNFWNILFCPFSQIPNYFLHFEEYRFQLVSWFGWFFLLGIFMFIFLKIKQKICVKKNLVCTNFVNQNTGSIFFLKIFLSFWLLLIFVIFFPYSGNKIQKTNSQSDEIIVDFHSHTYYSWDAMASFKRSIDFHKANGYDAYFMTEHDLILPEKTKVDVLKTKDIFVGFGEEVPNQDGLYHLFFNIKTAVLRPELASANYTDTMLSLKNINAIASSALWWEDISLEGLLEKNFSSVEISNMGHRNYRGIDIEYVIKKFRSKKIQMLGTTDWHGWGYISYIWTAVKIPNWQNMSYEQKEKALFDTLNGKYETRVLEYKKIDEKKTLIRYIFEPFFGIFYLLSSQSFLCLIIWFVWIFIFQKIIKFIYSKNKVHLFWLLAFFINLSMSLKFHLQFQTVKEYNKTLNHLGEYFLIISGLCLLVSFIVFKKEKVNEPNKNI